jgi:hypothetical protein
MEWESNASPYGTPMEKNYSHINLKKVADINHQQSTINHYH